jgi:antirestriction protein ArdC
MSRVSQRKNCFQGAKDMKNDANSTSRQDVYSRITSQIVASLEQGVRPWVKPWNAEHAAGRITRPLRFNGQPYSGINILSLWMSATAQGFAAPIWMTFRQAMELNAHVRKGEKGSLVVYANAIMCTEHDGETGKDVEREIPYLKGYTVFNVEQIDGLPDHYYAKAVLRLGPVARIERADNFFADCKATIRHGGNRAYYAHEVDYVQMPPFRDAESYYSTLAHEMTHWTKHSSRIARDLGRKQWGDEGYAQEELVAELGAAFLCADLDLASEPREENASHIANWLEALKNDTRFIFKAAAHAQRAVDFLRALSGVDAAAAATAANANAEARAA